MGFAKRLSLVLVTCASLSAQDLPQDPVMKARSERARSQGLREADLPAVPRGILEPPPLPPPETNHKDTRAGRLAMAHRKGRHGAKGSRRHPAAEPSQASHAKASQRAAGSAKAAPKHRKKRKA